MVQLVIIVFHGLNDHQGRYDYFAGRLNGEGFSVYLFDNCGHGRSDYVVDDYEKDLYVSEFTTLKLMKEVFIDAGIPWLEERIDIGIDLKPE